MTTTNATGWLRRMRDRQRRAGSVAVRPMYPARRPVPNAGERLAVAFDVFGISPAARAVLAARLAGETFGDIGAARGCSRQAVQCSEREALGRLGLAGSVESIVHADQRGGGAAAMHGRGADLRTAPELPAGRTWQKPDPADVAHEREVARFLRSKGVTA